MLRYSIINNNKYLSISGKLTYADVIFTLVSLDTIENVYILTWEDNKPTCICAAKEFE